MRKQISNEIRVIPIGFHNPEILDRICSGLESIFKRQTRLVPPIDLSSEGFDPDRKQFHSTTILRSIPLFDLEENKKTLGVVSVDIFREGLNFVFGEAFVGGDRALISLKRLLPEFYGTSPNFDLFADRAIKEAVHEIGHTFGLSHCRDFRCIMHYSNVIEHTDLKGPDFCIRCKSHIPNL